MFDKYCTAHVEKHNCHAALAKYDVAPLEESMKIQYFEDGITDPSLATVKTTILVDRTRFEDVDSVMRVYVNFKRRRSQKPRPSKFAMSLPSKVVEVVGRAVEDMEEVDKVDQVAALMEVSQEEIDKVTTIEARYYSPDEYAKFTPAEKQKHFQLMCAAKAAKSPAKTSSTSATMAELTTAVSAVSAAASAISELTVASTKGAAADCEVTNDSDANDQPGWGCNRDNAAVAGRQEHVPKKTRI